MIFFFLKKQGGVDASFFGGGRIFAFTKTLLRVDKALVSYLKTFWKKIEETGNAGSDNRVSEAAVLHRLGGTN